MILVPYDFSEPARRAFEYAQTVAGAMGAKVSLVHVVAPLVVYPSDPGGGADFETDLLKTARERLDAVVGICRLPGLMESVLVRTGSPFLEISQAARDLGADLIILGTHGFTGLKHTFVGSTAERVVRHAPCPVLTVRGE